MLSRFLSIPLMLAGAVSGLSILPIEQPSFKNPYANHGALIDVNVYAQCTNNLQVHIKIPSTSSWENSATFTGAAFDNLLVHGTSSHNAEGISTVRASWNGVDTLTISDFYGGSAAAAGAYASDDPAWINLNFHIPGEAFDQQGDDDLPVDFTKLPAAASAAKFINLVQKHHFSATASC